MKKLALIALSALITTNAQAQSATEYIELVCGTNEFIANTYSSDPLADVLKSKDREVAFWNSIESKIDTLISVFEKGGIDAVMSDEANNALGDSAYKACTAYATMANDIAKYAEKNSCVDSKDQPWNFLEFGKVCARWYSVFSGGAIK